ncbi:MAG: hypothetical protein HY263_05115 [Chloroflexi bacterium]|nr:hypothetical protein [Chloroflexota bacterium]
MRLVSADPLVFIGPGSEWFWTAVSGLVLAVTFLAILRQLRVQASANAYAQLAGFEAELHSERLTWAYYDMVSSLVAGVPPVNVPTGAATGIGNYWESIGVLVRGGHLDRRLAYTSISWNIQYAWATLAPSTANDRAATGMSAIFEHFEWLAGEMARMDRARGEVVVFDEAYLANRWQSSLASLRDQIRVFERSKVVYVRDAPEATAPDGPKRGDVAPGGALADAASQPPVA